MFNAFRIFAPPKHAVQSLAVQAAMVRAEKPRSSFEVLVRHFLDSFLTRGMDTADGNAKSYLLLAAYAVALPGLIVAMYLFVPYHSPHPRPYWSQVSDHYFYVIYSMVAAGVATIYEWDMFFPNLTDIFVLATLPIEGRTLFKARISAMAIFLASLILGMNLLGTIFFPAASDMPSLTRHLVAHLVATAAAGIFACTLVIAMQGMLVVALGQSLFQRISPILQGAMITILLTVLFLYPAISRVLSVLVVPQGVAVRYFPPLWFLGIYERLLSGAAASPAFGALAYRAVLATLAMVVLAGVLYPFTYQRKTRYVLEGRQERDTRGCLQRPAFFLLNRVVVRRPARRAIFHFIGQSLFRTDRHRVYLAIYTGVGMALVLACAIAVTIDSRGHAGLVLSADGLRASLPILIFWTISGMCQAFGSSDGQRAGWIFRSIHGRPGPDQLMPARQWILFWISFLGLATVATAYAVTPAELRGWRPVAVQLFAVAALCLLLSDAFLLRVKNIPFTGSTSGSRNNLAIVLVQYFGLFPALVLVTLAIEDWMVTDLVNAAIVVFLSILTHLILRTLRHRITLENADLLDVDEQDDEFPQRLGLRY